MDVLERQERYAQHDEGYFPKSRGSSKSPVGLDYRSHVSPITAVHKRTLNAYLIPCSEDIRDAWEMDNFLRNYRKHNIQNFVGLIRLDTATAAVESGQEYKPICFHLYERGHSKASSPFNSRSPVQRTFFISAVDAGEKVAWLLEITHQCLKVSIPILPKQMTRGMPSH
jgi:hypothetical protein